MSAYKDTERRTWYCQFRYTDYQGRTHRTDKRGFRTKKEAVKYEQDFRARAGKSNRMTMGALCDAYLEDKRVNAKASIYIAVRKIIENFYRGQVYRIYDHRYRWIKDFSQAKCF